MKYLVKNKIPDLTPYVSLSYNGDVNYMPISGSGLPSTIHAEEDGLYIEKNNRIWPMTHPDLSTLPSILPQRFGKLPIYEELIAVTDTTNDTILCREKEYYTSLNFFDEFCIELIKLSNNFRDLLYETNEILDVLIYYDSNSSTSYYLSAGGYNITFDPSNIIICTKKENVWNIFNKINYSQMKAGNYYDSAYIVYWEQHTSNGCTLYNKLIKVSTSNLKDSIITSTIFSNSLDSSIITELFVRARFISNNPYEDNLYIEDIYKIIDTEQPCIKINQPINRTNIIQASAFNENNYSPITIENNIVTTELNFKPDYILLQYFGEMDNYYYINSNNSNNSNSSGPSIGNFLMIDLTFKDINDVSDMSLVLGIYIGDNKVTGERLFVTAESLLNNKTYKFRESADTLPSDFQSSDFYTSITNVAGQENKIFAGRAPFATSGDINDVTVDWGGESNTEAWLYLINKYNLDLSDYPALEYASAHNGYLMGAGEGSLFETNKDAIWNAYTKLTGGTGDAFYSWQSSFRNLYSTDYSYLAYLRFYPNGTYSNGSYRLDGTGRVCLLITLSKKYTLYFDWITYKWCKGSYDTMTKYCTDSSYGYNGFTDNKTELDLEDDAAYVNWGPAWRMPSEEQFRELMNISYTSTLWTTQNGVNGRKITSRSNGNSIFLPAAGYRLYSSLFPNGHYWSRTCSTRSEVAWFLYFNSNDIYSANRNRSDGKNVRPICIDSSQAGSQAGYSYVDLGLPSGTLWATMNVGANSPTDYGLYFAWGETEGYQ